MATLPLKGTPGPVSQLTEAESAGRQMEPRQLLLPPKARFDLPQMCASEMP